MSKIEDDNGFWLCNDSNISKVGVFAYLGREISPKLEADKVYYVYRPAEELFSKETIDSFKSVVPLTDEHEMLGKDYTPAESKGVDGVVFDPHPSDDGLYLKGNVKIFSERMKHLLNRGKKELSMGYFCDYDLTAGEFNGQHYDVVQRNLRANHVALVDRGRSGSDVRVFDRAVVYDKEPMELTKMTKTIVKDSEVDKRKDISEVEAMLYEAKKDPAKLTDELIKTIVGKMETNSYNDSERSADDKACGDEDTENKEKAKDETSAEPEKTVEEKETKDEDEPEKEDEKKAMDAEIKSLKKALDSLPKEMAKAAAFAEKVAKKIGTFDSAGMTVQEIAEYACGKLGIKCAAADSVATLNGYLMASREDETYSISDKKSAMDSASSMDADLVAYLKG